MMYIVSAYKFNAKFTTEAEAKTCFDGVKNNFTYCELKKVANNNGYYYAESIEIFLK